MDTAHRRLPLPPITGSTKSSPTLEDSTDLASTPPKSPKMLRTPSSSTPPLPPRASPLPPLPAEVFLLIVRHLNQHERPVLRSVSKSWCAFLNAQPSLWSELVVRIPGTRDEYVSFWSGLADVKKGGQQGGGINKLTIDVLAGVDGADPSRRPQDLLSWEDISDKLEHIVTCVYDTSIESGPGGFADKEEDAPSRPFTLTSFKLTAHPNTISSFRVLEYISMWTCHLLSDVEHAVIQACLPGLAIDGSFLSMWRSAKTLTLRFVQQIEGWYRVPPKYAWDGGHNYEELEVDELPNLQAIDWTHLEIRSSLNLPEMPRLTRLSLSDCVWEGKGFFRLIRIVRKTIRVLHLANFGFTEADDMETTCWDDYDQNVMVTDQHLIDPDFAPTIELEGRPDFPPPILLPALREMSITGESTPLVWSPVDTDRNDMTWPTPTFIMPALRFALVEDTFVDPEDPAEGTPPLAVLCDTARELVTLDLTNTNVSDITLFRCLPAVGLTLRYLHLYHTEVTDHVVVSLDSLAPRLEELDVRSCTVTVQSVARVVERYRETLGRKLGRVYVDAPPADATPDEWKAWDWLNFHGLVHRADGDFDGPGPLRKDARQKWKRAGKQSFEGQRGREWRHSLETLRQVASSLVVSGEPTAESMNAALASLARQQQAMSAQQRAALYSQGFALPVSRADDPMPGPHAQSRQAEAGKSIQSQPSPARSRYFGNSQTQGSAAHGQSQPMPEPEN